MLEEITYLSMLALPPSVASLTDGLQMKMSSVFIGRSSGDNIERMLSALFIAQVFASLTNYALSEAFSIYVNILCSQAYGAKQYKLVGLYFYRALFIAALTFFPVCTVFISVRPIVYSITQDWELAYHAGSYTSVLCLGYPACIYFKSALRFLQAQNIVWFPLLILLLGNILNGVLQYVLIIHYNTGTAGAAASYVISMHFIALLLYAQIRFTRVHIVTHVNWTVDMIREWHHSAQYIIFPITQFFASMSATNLSPLILLGFIFHDTTQLAIYTVQISLWFVFSLWATGFSSAITARIGHLLGAFEYKKAFRAAIFSVFYGELVAFILATLLFVLSGPLSHLFTTDVHFVRDLSFNIKAMSFIILTDFQIFSQGILNGCCMQRTQAIVKFMCRTIPSIIIASLLTSLVEWRATAIFLSTGIGCSLSFVVGMMIILRSNWKEIALTVSKNTHKNNLHKEEELNESLQLDNSPEPCNTSKLGVCSIWESKLCNISRYCIGILVGGIIFSIVALSSFSS